MPTFDIGEERSIPAGSTQQFDVDPVFLLATERSGSNLTRSILNAHPDLTAPHPLETAYPWRSTASPSDLSARQRRRLVRDVLVNKHYSFQPLVDPLCVPRVQERVESAGVPSYLTVQEALYREYVEVTDTERWVSKDPGQWHYIDEFLSYYDDPKVVYLVRDARDVALSFKNSNVGKYHPYYTAGRWAEEQRSGLAMLDTLPDDRIHLLRYQDLLQDPESEVREVCSFLGIPFEERMLYYYDTEEAQQESESADVLGNIAIPIKSDNFDKFLDKLTAEEIRIVEKVAGEELEAFGFELVNDEATLEGFEPDEAAYEEAEGRLNRAAALEDWRSETGEQVARYAGRSFSIYMILRYGMLAGSGF
jgi:hypothetical protein